MYICSSEHLSSRVTTVEEIQRIKGLFPEDCTFEIVVYLRRQDELFLGCVVESIKAGASLQEVQDYKAVFTRKTYGKSYFQYEELLNHWGMVFGTSALIVRVFEKDQLHNGDVVADFMQILGINIPVSDINIQKKNITLSPEILLNFQEICDIHPHISRYKMAEYLARIDPFPKGGLIPAEDLSAFYSLFDEGNGRIARQYFHRDYLFTESPKYRYFDSSNSAKVTQAKAKIIQLFDEYLAKNALLP